MSSRIPGFYRLPPEARLSAIEDRVSALEPCDLAALNGEGLDLAVADMMVENVIGTFGLPNAVAVNFLINGREVLVPMVVEEPSVVAAASNMARLTRTAGGIWAEADASIMIGQVQVIPSGDPGACAAALEAALPRLAAMAQGVHPRLEERGGGLRGMSVRRVSYDEPGEAPEELVVLHFYLDCVDAMGANMVNTVAELLGPEVERLTGEPVGLQILSNLCDRRLARARVTLRPEHLDHGDATGEEVARAIASAYRFAYADPYRAATHNKGVLNGIDAVCLATGNDWRAIEAGAHAFAARSGQYRSLTSWKLLEDGSLRGTIELPMAIGTVGGPIRVHPTVQANLKILGNPRARGLAAIIAAVGLAQNLGAVRALATEGIQKGHMRMHARNVAATAGAAPEQVPEVSRRMAEARDYSLDFARRVIAELAGVSQAPGARFFGRGLGKLIVLGEHAVVYGHRALAAAVSLGTTVTLTRRDGPTALGDPGIRGADARLRQALAVALPPRGYRVDIATELPVGRGMGSSAALTVALLRAAAAARGEALTPEALHRRGFEIERIFHGTPSGLDHAVAAAGGALVYRRGEPPSPVDMPPTRVIVLDSGVAGDTAALVGGVRARRPGIDPALSRLGALVEEGLSSLDDPAALGAAMDEAHGLLKQIGVSTPQLDAMCQLARDAGALGAKLSGAGGGGVVVALAGDAGSAILRAAEERGINAFSCRLPGT